MASSDISELIRRVRGGDADALGELLGRLRERLLRMVGLRIDSRLRGRVDPSDVVQEAYLEASCRIDDYRRNADMPFYVWLRFLTAQKLAELHRHHLHVKARDAAREVSLFSGRLPEASSAMLAAQLLGQSATPSQVAMRAEMQRRLQEALEDMTPSDREIIVLRHFEQLSNAEAAHVLGLNESTTSTRHLRALKRLKTILAGMPDFRDNRTETSEARASKVPNPRR